MNIYLRVDGGLLALNDVAISHKISYCLFIGLLEFLYLYHCMIG